MTAPKEVSHGDDWRGFDKCFRLDTATFLNSPSALRFPSSSLRDETGNAEDASRVLTKHIGGSDFSWSGVARPIPAETESVDIETALLHD